MHETFNLFDILSTMATTISAAMVAGLLVFALSKTARGRVRAALLVALWFSIVAVLGATGILDSPSLAGVSGLGAAIVMPIAALCIAFLFLEPSREAISAVPLAVLIAVNVVRIWGLSFLLLHSAHRLPAPFAPVAGWGDIFGRRDGRACGLDRSASGCTRQGLGARLGSAGQRDHDDPA